MVSEPMTSFLGDDIAVNLQEHIGIVEICRPPDNFFDVTLLDAVADGFGRLVAEPACRAIVLAAVQGPAIGGGLGLALVADFRVVAPEARFAANFVKLGIHPGFGITATLPRLIGIQKASMMLLTGRRITGAEAML